MEDVRDMEQSHVDASLAHLERQSRCLDPPRDVRDDWKASVDGYVEKILGRVDDNCAAKTYNDEVEQCRGFFRFTGPDLFEAPAPGGMGALLDLLDRRVAGQGEFVPSGRHVGYMPGGGLFASGLGDYLAAAINCQSGVFKAAPGAVMLERQLLSWMASLVGYDPEAAEGNLTSGGSVAHLAAIVAARDSLGVRSGDAESLAIYVSEHVHRSILKAVRIAGLADAAVRTVRVTDEGTMDLDHLRKAVETDRGRGKRPFLVVGTAGTTDAGAVDPLGGIARVARGERMWFHVDAAYGGFFLLCDEVREAFAGVGESDSVTVDPHKGLFVPFGLGAVLVRNGGLLRRSSLGLGSDDLPGGGYMHDQEFGDVPSPCDLSPELSRHFRGLRLWLPLRLHGLGPFRCALKEKLLLARRYLYEELRRSEDVEVGPVPMLTVVLFRYRFGSNSSSSSDDNDDDDDKFNLALLREVQRDGRAFISSTTVGGKFWLRMAVLNHRTHRSSLELAVRIVKERARELRKAMESDASTKK